MSNNNNNQSTQPATEVTRRRKTFKSETLRLTSTVIDVADNMGRALGSTAKSVEMGNTHIVQPLIESGGELLQSWLKPTSDDKARSFYDKNIEMYVDLKGVEAGKAYVSAKVDEIVEGK